MFFTKTIKVKQIETRSVGIFVNSKEKVKYMFPKTFPFEIKGRKITFLGIKKIVLKFDSEDEVLKFLQTLTPNLDIDS